MALFAQGAPIENVVTQTGRSRSTIVQYLTEYIEESRPASIEPWVSNLTYQLVTQAARRVGADWLRPIFVALGEQVPYDDIRLVLAHLRTRGSSSA